VIIVVEVTSLQPSTIINKKKKLRTRVSLSLSVHQIYTETWPQRFSSLSLSQQATAENFLNRLGETDKISPWKQFLF
jgi:hypothetical protein